MIVGTEFILEDFDSVWPSLADRCARWVPEHSVLEARAACEEGRAVCLACSDGLAVVALECRESGTMRANVLLAASIGLSGAFARQERSMLDIAKDIGAAEIVFWTPRRGWGRLLGPEWRRDGEWFARSVG